MAKNKTSLAQLKFITDFASNLQGCGVRVEKITFQAPDAIAEAVPVLYVSGNPVRYRLIEPPAQGKSS